MIGRAVNFINRAAAALVKVIRPVAKAERPKETWSNRVSKNGEAPMTMRGNCPPTTEAKKLRVPSKDRSTIGPSVRRA